MLSDRVLLDGGFWLYCSEYADEFEAHGGSFGPGAEITHCVDRPPDEKLLPIMRGYEKKLADAWGRPVEEVFGLMGLEETDYADALYYTLMACRGHGVGLQDDYGDAIDRYESATGVELDTSPIRTELLELNGLASELLEVPDEEYGVYDSDGKLLEGRFWDEEAAEDFIRDTSPHFDGCTVRLVNP
jgi:hypothetical protein